MSQLGYFYYFFFRYNFQLLIGVCISVFPLKKRKHFALRLSLSTMLYVISSFLLIYFDVHFVVAIVSLDFLLYFFMVLGIIFLCFDVSIKEVLFYGMASYTIQNLNDNLTGIVYYCLDLNNEIIFTTISLGISLLTYPMFCFLFYKKINKSGRINVTNSILILTTMLTVSIVYLLNMLTRIYATKIDVFHYIYAVISCLLLLFCQFGIFAQGKLDKEKEVVEQMLYQDSIYQKASEENINLINIKCHDLKHQINLLKETSDSKEKDEIIQDLEKQVTFFNANLKTGSKPLDILLMEKSMVFEKNNIQLACMIDGEKLSFMKSNDLYTLFSNAIDNAIESLIKIDDIQKRLLTINVKEKAGALIIRIENPYIGNIFFENGLPKTSKQDSSWHGFGTKSIRYIVDKYKGTMTINTSDNVYGLNISFRLNA